jgi:hypothetical protein
MTIRTLALIVGILLTNNAFASDGQRMSGVEKGLAQVHGKDIRFCAFRQDQPPVIDDNTASYSIRCVDVPRAHVQKVHKDCTLVLVDVGGRAEAAIYCGTEGTL